MSRSLHRALLHGLLAALCLGGCDGGGGGSSASGGGPTAPSPAIVFTPDGSAAAPRVAMRAGPGTTASVLELEIVATDLVNVQTMDFILAFPGDLLELDTVAPGPFLGPAVSLVVDRASAGSLVIRMTRSDPSGATGSGVVLTLSFRAIASGGGRFGFVEPEAADPFGLEIPGIAWTGGTVQVVV